MAKRESIIIKLDIDEKEAKKKIVENTTAIRNFAQQNRELAKALKEGKISEEQYTKALLENQQAAKALKDENKQLELSIKASENSVSGLRARIALLTKEVNDMDMGSEEFAKAQAELKALNDELIKIGEDRSNFKDNVGNYASAVKGFENHIDSLKKKLDTLDINSKEFRETHEEIKKATKELENLKNGVTGIEAKLNEFGNKFSDVFSGLGNLGTKLKAAFGPAAIVGGVAVATGALINLKMELDATREQVNLLTGATGDALDEITAKTQATAKTFDKDFNETLVTANTIAQQFGISVPEALDLIQQGFVNGADARGEFLADLHEFAPQFKQIGLDASQAIAIMAQQPQSGVFSNKGIDAIKEAGLRLREMPNATREALNAIGLSADTIQKQIQDGTITTFEAIQQVSGRLAELPDSSQVAAQAVADIFGGAGQNAGLAYLRTIKDIETSLDTLTEGADEFAQANLQIVDAQERIDLLMNQILGGGGNMFRELKGMALDFVANALEFIVNGTINIINWFRELYNESLAFRGAVNFIRASWENMWAVVKGIFNGFVQQLKDVGAIIKAIFTGDFKAIPDLIQQAFKNAVDNVKNTGAEMAQNFKDGFNETINPSELLEPISLAAGDAEIAFYGAGLAAGAAFNEGAKQSREDYLKDQKAFLETQLLLAEEHSQEKLELQMRLIEIERDLALTEEGLTANQRLLIQTQALVDLQKAQEDHYQGLKELREKQLEEELTRIAEGEQRKTLELQRQLAQRVIDEQTFHANLFAIREEALEAEIAQLEEGSLAKLEKEVELEELRAERIAAIRQREIETSRLVAETEISNNAARLESTKTLVGGISEIADETTEAGKIAREVSKAVSIGEIVFNLQQEQAANAAAGAKISAQAPPATIPAGVAYTSTRNAIAIARAAIGIGKVVSQSFDHGGIAFAGGHIPADGGMITGRPHSQGGVLFAMGGGIGEADGRKGEAYIINTRRDPRLKALASAINVAGGGRAFYDLGGVVPGVSGGSLLPPPTPDIATILENLPTPVVLVDDIVNGTNQKVQVENGAIL